MEEMLLARARRDARARLALGALRGIAGHGAHCDVDTSQIKHRDLYDAADDIDKLIADGVTSVNDVLRDFSRDQIDEAWASEHLRTKNYETAVTSPGGTDGGENNE